MRHTADCLGEDRNLAIIQLHRVRDEGAAIQYSEFEKLLDRPAPVAPHKLLNFPPRR